MADVRELRYFAAVYEDRSVSAAARRCFVSQPSVSAALASLEHELGTALFVRHRKGAAPTPAGDRLYPIARRLVDEARGLRGLFAAPARPRRLALGLMRSVAIERVLPIVEPLAHVADLQLVLVDAGALASCDARIVADSMLAPGEAFVPLWDERYVVALPAAHPLALRPRLAPGDFAELPLIERCRCEHAERLARGRPRSAIVARAHTEEWAFALVAAGVGAAIMPESSVRADPRVAVRAIAHASASRRVGLAYPARTPPAAELLAIARASSTIAPARRQRSRRRRSMAADPLTHRDRGQSRV